MLRRKGSSNKIEGIPFTNRDRDEIYHDILLAVNELQYTEPLYSRALNSRVNQFRTRKFGGQMTKIRGALLRNVMMGANLSTGMCKKYLMEMATLGIIDLGIYLGNVSRDHKSSPPMVMGNKRKKAEDKLITITDKGYRVLKILSEMREMIEPQKKKQSELTVMVGY